MFSLLCDWNSLKKIYTKYLTRRFQNSNDFAQEYPWISWVSWLDSAFFVGKVFQWDVILLELTVFKAAPQISFAKLCDLLKNSCKRPKQKHVLFSSNQEQSWDHSRLAFLVFSRAWKTGRGTCSWVLWRYHIVFFCHWDFFSFTVMITKLFSNTDSLFGSSSSSPARYATRKRNRRTNEFINNGFQCSTIKSELEM